MKAWASGHGKAAINAVMIDCLFTGQCHPSKPASLADNFREWHEKFLRQNTTLSRLDSIHCKTTTVIKPYCKKPGDNSIVCNRAHYAVFQRVSLIWYMRLNEMKTRHGQRIQEDINGGSRGQVSIATRSGGGLEYSLRRGKDSHPGYAEACRFTTFRHVPPGACRCARWPVRKAMAAVTRVSKPLFMEVILLKSTINSS